VYNVQHEWRAYTRGFYPELLLSPQVYDNQVSKRHDKVFTKEGPRDIKMSSFHQSETPRKSYEQCPTEHI
jgi:hypothetical protein